MIRLGGEIYFIEPEEYLSSLENNNFHRNKNASQKLNNNYNKISSDGSKSSELEDKADLYLQDNLRDDLKNLEDSNRESFLENDSRHTQFSKTDDSEESHFDFDDSDNDDIRESSLADDSMISSIPKSEASSHDEDADTHLAHSSQPAMFGGAGSPPKLHVMRRAGEALFGGGRGKRSVGDEDGSSQSPSIGDVIKTHPHGTKDDAGSRIHRCHDQPG